MSMIGIRRLCVAVDVHRYSGRDVPNQHATQERLIKVLTEAMRRANVPPVDLLTQEGGDSQIALLPPGINEPEVIADLVRHVRIELFQLNRDLAPRARLRLRMAMHQGLTYLADAGYAGNAVIHLTRLLDAKPLKQRMADHEDADLGLIVADCLFEEVIRHEPVDLRAADFERVEVEHPDKNFRSAAWISLPDTRRPPADPPTQPAEPRGDRTQNIWADRAAVSYEGDINADFRGR